MNDRGVYLPDDYNSDTPPAQVRSTTHFQANFLVTWHIKRFHQGAPVPVDMRLRVLQVAEVDDNQQTMTVEMAVSSGITPIDQLTVV